MPKRLATENPEMLVPLMFPSRFLRAADLMGEITTLTIKEVKKDNLRLATGGITEKYVISFQETDKMLVLNKTNAQAICKVLGEPRAIRWPGLKITIMPAKCEAFGSVVDCIRVESREAV